MPARTAPATGVRVPAAGEPVADEDVGGGQVALSQSLLRGPGW